MLRNFIIQKTSTDQHPGGSDDRLTTISTTAQINMTGQVQGEKVQHRYELIHFSPLLQPLCASLPRHSVPILKQEGTATHRSGEAMVSRPCHIGIFASNVSPPGPGRNRSSLPVQGTAFPRGARHRSLSCQQCMEDPLGACLSTFDPDIERGSCPGIIFSRGGTSESPRSPRLNAGLQGYGTRLSRCAPSTAMRLIILTMRAIYKYFLDGSSHTGHI